MSLQKGMTTQTNAVEIGGGLTAALHNLPTLNISASGTISLAGIQCVNFIDGISVVIASASLVNNQVVLFVQTGGRGPVRLSLDNSGLIGGSAVYQLSGAVLLYYTGTSLQ